jgi:hypothetical protein
MDAFYTKSASDGKGGFYALTYTNSTDGDIQRTIPVNFDLWLIHIDSVGNLLWENTFGGPSEQAPTTLCRGADGSIWMGARTDQGLNSLGGLIYTTYGGVDGWVVHADSSGNFLNGRIFGADKDEQIDMLYPPQDRTVLAGGRYYENFTPGSGSPGFP